MGLGETGRGREVHRECPHQARPLSVRRDGVAAWGCKATLAGGDAGEIQGRYRGMAHPAGWLGGWLPCMADMPDMAHL